VPQLELLKKISDTLGVLGLGELRQRVQQEVRAVGIVSDGKTPSEEPRWSRWPACCCRSRTASTISWCA
jgi:hypothetical protein